MLYLSNFTVIRPEYEYSQEQSLHWIAKAHQQSLLNENTDIQPTESYEQLLRKLLALGVGKNKIEKRGTVVPDFTHDNFSAMDIYQINGSNTEGKDIKVRSTFFEKTADHIFEMFYGNTPIADHLLQVTCTGYVYPSAAQKIASKTLSFNSTVTNVFHMGCYASIPAIRLAAGMVSTGETADIVHTEMCSLHMNPALHDIEQLVVQTLFADGFIKYSVSNSKQSGFEVLAMSEVLIPDSIESMSWKQEGWGMKMHIDKQVPTLIKEHVSGFIQSLFNKAGMDNNQPAYYAIHPGGPKIIDELAKHLALSSEQIEHSKQILKNYGNMSSATLPHIWEAISKDPSIKEGALIVSLAFGPGLTIAGALMKKSI